jgi:hypothetical protein
MSFNWWVEIRESGAASRESIRNLIGQEKEQNFYNVNFLFMQIALEMFKANGY